MAEMLGELAVDVPADFRARPVGVNDEMVRFYNRCGGRRGLGLWRCRALRPGRGRIGFGTRATRPETKAKDADNGNGDEGFEVHETNSKEVCAGHKESLRKSEPAFHSVLFLAVRPADLRPLAG
jgi:hypothetical protein